jgi:hypothetical protein
VCIYQGLRVPWVNTFTVYLSCYVLTCIYLCVLAVCAPFTSTHRCAGLCVLCLFMDVYMCLCIPKSMYWRDRARQNEREAHVPMYGCPVSVHPGCCAWLCGFMFECMCVLCVRVYTIMLIRGYMRVYMYLCAPCVSAHGACECSFCWADVWRW